MADEPEAPSGGGFSLTKRYGPLPAWAWGLIGGIGAYAGYRFWQSRKGGSAAAASSTDQTTGVDFAPQIATLQSEIQQLQQGEGGEATSKPGPTIIHDPGPPDKDGGGGGDTDDGSGGGGGGTVKKMPDVVGERANFAIGELKSGYGVKATTVPRRDPKKQYVVTGQQPRAGAGVRRGSRATLRVRPGRGRNSAA